MVQVGLLLVMVASVAAEAFRDIEFKNCKTTSGTLSCKVKHVKVKGCHEPTSWVDDDGSVVEYEKEKEKNPCRIVTNSNLNFSITFEPGYSIDNVRSQFTVPALPENGCPVDTTPEFGCSHTKCPLQPGLQQRYETTLFVYPDIPTRPVNDRKIYQLKWKLWNNKDKNKKHSCCFTIPMQF